MVHIKEIIKNVIQKKCNYMCNDLYNYIYEFIFEPIDDITVHYEEKKRNWDIEIRNKKLKWDQFICGFMKCILHKKQSLNNYNIIPYLRNDIIYFTNKTFYKDELETFIKKNPLNYLFYYQEIYNYVNSYSKNLSLYENDKHKMYVIYYHNKDNSLNRILNSI